MEVVEVFGKEAIERGIKILHKNGRFWEEVIGSVDLRGGLEG